MSDEQYYEKVTSLKDAICKKPIKKDEFMVLLAKGILFGAQQSELQTKERSEK